MKAHIVRKMKPYGETAVANAIGAEGYYWPRRRPSSIDRMTCGLPRVVLVKVLARLSAGEPKNPGRLWVRKGVKRRGALTP